MTVATARTSMLATLQSITDIPSIKVEGENFKPTKSTDYPFIRFMVQPRESTPRDLGSGKQIASGLAWIQLYYSRSNNSVADAYTLADQILNTFELGSTLLDDSQLVITASWSEKVTEEASAIVLPIFIRWVNYAL